MRRNVIIAALAALLITAFAAQPARAQLSSCVPRSDWTGTYRVSPGETLYRIAARFGMLATELAAGNCIVDPNRVNAGQVLRVPDNSNPPPTGPITPTPGGQSTTWFPLQGNPVGLYSAPSKVSPQIASLSNVSIRLLGRTADSNWLMVQTSNGLNGWVMTNQAMVHSTFITPLPIFGAGPTTDNAYIQEVGVRLRTGPGFQYPVRRYLSRQQVQVFGKSADGGWLRVRAAGVEGWVYAGYVVIDPGLVMNMPVLG